MKLKFRAEPKDVVIFGIFAFFLLYLVAIGVLNLHALTVEARFWGLNPFPAFTPDYIAATLVFFLLALIGLSLSVSSYFFDREKGFGYQPGKKEESGYAKFMNSSEMKKKPDIEKIILEEDEYKVAGIPIMLNTKEAYVDNGESHSLVIGGTGSGKSQCVMIPMARILAKAGESMIFTDPKGELYKDIGGMLKERGYNIIVLNFRDPLKGNCWNPFSLPYKFYKEGKDDKSKELIEDLASNIIMDPDSKAEPFWEETASAYFSGLAMGLFDDAENEEYVNINSINQMATVGEERLNNSTTYLQKYFKDKGETSNAYVSASATINAPNETRGGITSTFKSKIRIFSSRESLSEMLSKTDFDFSKVGKEKTAVFLIIHDEKKTYHSLVTIFLKQIYESLVDVASNEPNLKLPIRTNFLLDEFANMPPLTDVDAMITASRSRNMRFNFIIQNYSQLNKQYGQDMAETIKGNCSNILFLTTTELKALEEISKLCGEKKGKKNKDKPDEPDRPLMTVSDLQKLKKFEFLILKLRCHPFKTQFKADYEINKVNGWGAQYDSATLPSREPNQLKIFDVKEFVNKKLNDQLSGGDNNGSFGGITKLPPMGQFMGPKPNGNNVMPNMEEFIKNIDATIAKLEAEEKAEKERLQNERNKEKPKPVIEKEEKKPIKVKPLTIEPQISDHELFADVPENIIEEHIKESEKEEKKPTNIIENVEKKLETPVAKPIELETKTDEDVKKEKEQQGKEIEHLMNQISQPKEMKQKEETKEKVIQPKVEPKIEKPKINVDIDSIIVDDNVTDDEFFDDFFGDDDEE